MVFVGVSTNGLKAIYVTGNNMFPSMVLIPVLNQ